jgi:fatty acid desaturase
MARWWEWDGTQAGPAPIESDSDWKIGLGVIAWFAGIVALIGATIAGLLFRSPIVAGWGFAVVAVCFVIGFFTARPSTRSRVPR